MHLRPEFFSDPNGKTYSAPHGNEFRDKIDYDSALAKELHVVFTYPLFLGLNYAIVSCKFFPETSVVMATNQQNWLQAHKRRC